jgi:hypothetical protein
MSDLFDVSFRNSFIYKIMDLFNFTIARELHVVELTPKSLEAVTV